MEWQLRLQKAEADEKKLKSSGADTEWNQERGKALPSSKDNLPPSARRGRQRQQWHDSARTQPEIGLRLRRERVSKSTLAKEFERLHL